jgi:GH24 family phage-related lysozyme (muramidase)
LRLRAVHRQHDEDTLFADLKTWEGCVAYMYLDTVGLVTVGIGNLLRTVDDAKALPFIDMDTGKPASQQAIEAAYSAVNKMPPAQHWSKYKLRPSLELSEETSGELALARVANEFLPRLRRAFPDFDTYPPSAQRFMIDMAYNGGVGYFRKRNMVGLIEQRRWSATIPFLPTHGNPRRNAWREQLLRQAALEDAR